MDTESEHFTGSDSAHLTLALSHAPSASNDNKHPSSSPAQSHSWRHLPRMRTVSCALVLCLNIGVDPPDQMKPSPCARLECWFDPDSMPPLKALKQIGLRLKTAYERWHEKGKYRVELDPTSEALRKLLLVSRKSAGDERVLFHYNGHGVPKPTNNGEIWVYNSGYTQYIPVSIYDIQAWMGPFQPAIYVIDCNQAGVVLEAFQHFIKQRRDREERKLKHTSENIGSSSSSSGAGNGHGNDSVNSPSSSSTSSTAPVSPYDCRHIFLCACNSVECLPLNLDLPADLFTACLTTPIKTALRWFSTRSPLTRVSYDLIDSLPGMKKPNNRKTPYGELNWIFTAITDSIAWSTLPLPLFHSLFRQDLLVASLFRNYFLAQRIFHSYDLHTITFPSLPNTHNHPMWQAWDLAVDTLLAQLEKQQANIPINVNNHTDADNAADTDSSTGASITFLSSPFFEHQLTAFEVWLEFGNERQSSPMQLPVVLQVLLSADHRRRALLLLARYLDKGAWAVQAALNVGIFPYVLKLLQSPDIELREVLVFIWTKVLAFDPSTANDLSKPDYCQYFVSHLLNYNNSRSVSVSSGGGGVTMIGSTSGSSTPSHSNNVSPMLRPSVRLAADTETTIDGDVLNSHCVNEYAPSQPSPSVASPAQSLLLTNPSPHQPTYTSVGTPVQTARPSPFPLISADADSDNPLPLNDPAALTRHTQRWLSTPDMQHLFATFILANIAHTSPRGAQTILTSRLPSFLSLIHPHSQSPNPLLRRWILLCLVQLWCGYPAARLNAAIDRVHEHVCSLLFDPVPEVRAAALLSLSALFGKNTSLQPSSTASTIAEKDRVEIEIHIGYVMSTLCFDGSAIVRRELIIGLAECVYHHTELFLSLSSTNTLPRRGDQSLKKAWLIWRTVLRCCKDPVASVSQAALEVKKWINSRALFTNPVGRINASAGHASVGVTSPTSASSNQASPPSASTPTNTSTVPKTGPLPPIRPSLPFAGLRHFDRYKMSHMRPQPHISHAQSRTASPNPSADNDSNDGDSVSASDSDSSSRPVLDVVEPAPVDERANDPMWTVPRSTLFTDSVRHLSTPLIPMIPSDDSTSILSLATMRAKHQKLSKFQNLCDRTRRAARDWKYGSSLSFVEVAFFDTEWESTSCVRMSETESLLFASDSCSSIGVWHYGVDDNGTGQERINIFNNENIRGSKITSMTIVNPLTVPLLLIGSDDGVVRLWRDVDKQGRQSVVTAFTAMPQPEFSAPLHSNTSSHHSPNSNANNGMPRPSPPLTLPHPLSQTLSLPTPIPQSHSAVSSTTLTRRRTPRIPLVTDWCQHSGRLSVSGHGTPMIKVWDVDAELCVSDLIITKHSKFADTSPVTSHVTSLVSDGQSSLLYVGSNDGTVQLFDLRMSNNNESASMIVNSHDSTIVSLTMKDDARLSRSLVSASSDGEVCVHDLRQSDIRNSRPHRYSRPSHMASQSPLSAFATHRSLPLFASASSVRPFVEIFDSLNHTVDSIKYHIGFLGQRIGAVNSLDFHPHRSLIGVGCQDPYISIFAAEKL